VPPLLPEVEPPASGLYRIARGDPDPFSPPDWEYAGAGRFDDPELFEAVEGQAASSGCFRTIYLAESRATAFREVLQDFRARPELLLKLRLQQAGGDPSTLEESLRGAYDLLDGTVRGIVHREWRWRRRIAHIYLDGHVCADVASPAAWTHLMHVPEIQRVIQELGISSIDMAAMASPQRALTQACARYVHEQMNDDGTPRYAGIRFHSRVGSAGAWDCWAMFDDRMSRSRAGNGRPILATDMDLQAVAYEFDLTLVDDDGKYVVVT
jgi:hypothetical protein